MSDLTPDITLPPPVNADLAKENARLREALLAALEVMDDLPTWSNAGHACNLARAALKGASQ